MVKNIVETGHPIDTSRIISVVKDYDVVSFDVFDTLLKRNVRNPIDIFAYIEKKMCFLEFTKKRIEAEKKAREHSGNNEITIHDIYREYGDDYSSFELNAESEFLIANEDMLPVFNYCIENKRVILTSDMYLTECFISQILKREGISGYEKLYLSSTIGKTKSTGELFEFLIDDLKVDRNKIVHIGDSIKSDYIVPKSLGITAIHIPTYIKKAEYQLSNGSIEENIISSFINNTIPHSPDKYYRFGYEKFGMFLWGYSKWLHDSVTASDIKKVYFLSRDGLIMKKTFDSLYSDIETHYIEVSRRALRVPVLWMNYEFEHVLDMISPSKLVPLSTIFDGVGLNIEDYKDLVHECGFKTTTCFDRHDILKNNQLKDLYKRLAPDIESVSKQEYRLLVKYIKQNNMAGKFAIVDIGWAGSMQRFLCEILDKLGIKHEIKGFYIGVAERHKQNQDVVPDLDLNGYLFDFSHDKNAVDKRRPFVGLFETLFLEQAGSVKNYIDEGGVVKGNRLAYEYIENGEPTYELQCVKKIQEGAIDFVKRFGNRDIELDAATLFEGIEETGLRPTKKDLNMFADFRFFDEGETQCLAKPKSLICYATHTNELKKDFLLSRWKIGFMKRMMKIRVPYEKIYRYMLRLK